MKIKRIDFSTPNWEEYLNISSKEIREIHNIIVSAYDRYLKDYGVKKLWSEDIPVDCSNDDFVGYLDAKELQLIFLYKYLNCLVHKDMVSAFVRKHIPNAALDQQVRHLGSQYLWYVLNIYRRYGAYQIHERTRFGN